MNLLRAVGRGRSEEVATISIVEPKRHSSSDFAEEFFKNNTVFVIKCFGNIHTDEIIFHFNCDIMVSVRAGKSFLFWKLQEKNEFQIEKYFSGGCHSCVVILKLL